MTTTTQTATARRAHAAAEWAALRDRLQTVTPQAIGRGALTLGAIAGAVVARRGELAGAAAVRHRRAPRLPAPARRRRPRPGHAADRWPRSSRSWRPSRSSSRSASSCCRRSPTRSSGSPRDLPTPPQSTTRSPASSASSGSLPEGSAAVLIPVVSTLAATVRDVFSGRRRRPRRHRPGRPRGAAQRDRRAARAHRPADVDARPHDPASAGPSSRSTPGSRRASAADVWAAAAIVDRAAGSYLRGYVVAAFLVGILTYIGLSRVVAARRAAVPGAARARDAGRRDPGRARSSGRSSALLPALLLLAIDPSRAATYFAVYLGARIIGATSSGSRLMERRLGVHPAILVPGVVMIGQFGILPAAAVGADRRDRRRPRPVRPRPPVRAAAAGRRPAPDAGGRCRSPIPSRPPSDPADPSTARPPRRRRSSPRPRRRPPSRRRAPAPRHDWRDDARWPMTSRPRPPRARPRSRPRRSRPAAPALSIQLTQVRVPLDEAADALATPDSAGRLPIVVLPQPRAADPQRARDRGRDRRW